MHRTNIYLDDEQVLALKHLAAEERESMAQLVRRAVDEFLTRRLEERDDWGARFDALVARVQSRIPKGVAAEEIEADISAARQEARDARRTAPGASARARRR